MGHPVTNFYMPGEADGISRRQYSPRSPARSSFLYPTLSPIDFLSSCFVLLLKIELCKGTFGLLRISLGASVII